MISWVVPLIFLILVEGVADIFSKEWALKGKPIWWVSAIMGYIVANVFWLSSIRNGAGLARGAILFSVGSAIIAVVLGLVLFKESTSKLEVAGIILGIISIILILWAKA